jgi:ABC-type glycerol-3-phosphate transport system substrate-binding protein
MTNRGQLSSGGTPAQPLPQEPSQQGRCPTRRTLLASAAGAGFGIVLAACGGAESGRAPEATVASRPSATLSYLTPGGADVEMRLRQTFDRLTKEKPHLRVDIVPVPQGQSWLQALIVRSQGGTPIDAFEGYTYWHDLQPAGAAVDLTDRFKRDKVDTAKFVPDPIDNATINGKLYGMPISLSTDALGYNLDLLQQAGVAPPPANMDDKSWTTERFLEMAQKLTKAGQQWGFGGTYNGGGALYHDGTFFGAGPWDAKTRKLTFDTAGFRRGLEFWRDLDLKYHVQPTAAEMAQLVAPGKEVFATGKVALQCIYIGFKPDFKWGLATLPYSGTGPNISGRVGLHTMFMGPGKVQDAAWEMVSWFGQPEPGGLYVWSLGHAASPQLDPKASEYPQKVWRDSYGVDPKPFVLQSRSAKRARWGLAAIAGWGNADTEIMALYRRFRAGEVSTDEFVRESDRIGGAVIAAAK